MLVVRTRLTLTLFQPAFAKASAGTSGGLIFAGIANVFATVPRQRTWFPISMFSLFCVMVVLLVVLKPWLHVPEQMTPELNSILFAAMGISLTGSALSDIQTGSLVTPPCPYRIMSLDDNFIKIDTKRITDVNVELPEGFTFLTYCNSVINDRLNSFFYIALRYMFKVPKTEALLAAPVCVNAFKAYISGDEKITDAATKEIADIVPQVPSFSPLESILYSWWTDLPPNDNKTHIKLK